MKTIIEVRQFFKEDQPGFVFSEIEYSDGSVEVESGPVLAPPPTPPPPSLGQWD